MTNEVILQVNLKKAALDKSQSKIDEVKLAIEAKQRTLAKLEAAHTAKSDDLARMQEIASEYETNLARDTKLRKRLEEIVSTHDSDKGKIRENPEYVEVISELEELKPKLDAALPTVKKIYYGKG